MSNAIVVKGRLVGPRSVELDEPVTAATPEVQVIVQGSAAAATGSQESVFDFLLRLPPGTRSREDIDQQIREERESWGER